MPRWQEFLIAFLRKYFPKYLTYKHLPTSPLSVFSDIYLCRKINYQYMTAFILSKELKLDAEKEILFTLPENEKIKIEELQLEINCGFNMLDKKVQITIYGERKIELPVITLSQMYKLLIDLSSLFPKEKEWYVTHLLIKPCQTINYSISFGVNKLTGLVPVVF